MFCLILLSITLFTHAADARDIYVRLADTPSSMAISSSGGLTVVDAARKTSTPGTSIVLKRSGSSVVIGNTKHALPLRISGSGLLGYNSRKYRGEFLVTREFVLINVLDVEDYIRGVLPAEVGAGWPAECLRAQAIISRTYGIRQSFNRSARGYDVVDTTSDQVYRGAGAETPSTDKAVRDTEGEVLAYGSDLAFTPFHSDSGGYTATNAHVWGKNLAYLTGVKEPVDYNSPHSGWTAKISASQVQAALSKVGVSVGQVKEIRIAEVDKGGRAVSLTFVGSAGTSSVKSSLFRTAVGPNFLKSTMLTNDVPLVDDSTADTPEVPEPQESPWISEASEEDDALPKAPVPTSNTPMSGPEEVRLTRMTSDGVFTTAELMDMLMNPEKRKGYLYIGIQRGSAPKKAGSPKTAMPKSLPDASMPVLRSGQIVPMEGDSFVFRGRGWGHGVGLSQWGAQAAAKAGWTAERILEYYYPGAAVKHFK